MGKARNGPVVLGLYIVMDGFYQHKLVALYFSHLMAFINLHPFFNQGSPAGIGFYTF
ncbi:hypothetical protein D3C85_1501940 [compost metagenome]